MFRIKICGITTPADARLAVEAGADAIGLNFCEASPRHIDEAAATAICAAIPAGALKVGVFVNASPDDVRRSYDKLGLDLVQLHGDEPPEQLQGLADLPLVRAFRCGPSGLGAVSAYLESCRVLGSPPRMVLIDAFQPGDYGGTGQLAPWDLAARFHDLRFPYPLVLAGGLNADNVIQAIAQVRPAAVDVASGVESSPGVKDVQKVRAFVARASRAFDALRRG